MTGKYHINPRFRAYGKARLDVTLRAKNEQEWQEMWREPYNAFPFSWASDWKYCFLYMVDDFAAEVGFFIDILGFEVGAFSPRYAQFTSPGKEICFSVVSVDEGEESTSPDTIQLQLNIVNVKKTIKDLENRGVEFNTALNEDQDGLSKLVGYFRSPHGVRINLWNERQTTTHEDREIDMEDMDDDETDRLIDELLGLSDDNYEINDDLTDNEDEDIDQGLYTETSIDEDMDDADDRVNKVLQSPIPEKENGTENIRNKASTPINQPHLPFDRRLRQSKTTIRDSSQNWPHSNDRRNGDVVYDEIEEDFPLDMD